MLKHSILVIIIFLVVWSEMWGEVRRSSGHTPKPSFNEIWKSGGRGKKSSSPYVYQFETSASEDYYPYDYPFFDNEITDLPAEYLVSASSLPTKTIPSHTIMGVRSGMVFILSAISFSALLVTLIVAIYCSRNPYDMEHDARIKSRLMRRLYTIFGA